jgi:carnitine O-acetyltransferase
VDISRQIERIIKQAGHDEATSVGVLTSDNRDHWADAREDLLAASPINAKSLERIEGAVVLIALDDISPVTREDASWATWVGNGRNRFYDKHNCQSLAVAERKARY